MVTDSIKASSLMAGLGASLSALVISVADAPGGEVFTVPPQAKVELERYWNSFLATLAETLLEMSFLGVVGRVARVGCVGHGC